MASWKLYKIVEITYNHKPSEPALFGFQFKSQKQIERLKKSYSGMNHKVTFYDSWQNYWG